MRIVDVCGFWTPHGGGVRTYIEGKMRATRHRGDEIVVVVPGERLETAVTDGGTIVSIPGPRFPLYTRCRYFNDEEAMHRVLDDLMPDVVEVSSPWGSPAMVARWRGTALRSLVMHADPLSAYAYRWFGSIAARDTIDRRFEMFWRHLRRLNEAFDLVVCASEGLTERMIQGGVSKATTIPMGVTPGLFSPSLRNPALRAHLLARCDLPEDATLLIGLGRHASEKRWPMVIEAVAAAGSRRPVGLLLLGHGRDEATVVRAAKGNPHVHLGAPVFDRPRLATILASADALVHGCEAETFCMAAAEARASGIPIIVPDLGGAADQLRPGFGEKYVARSAASLADAIVRQIDAGETMLRRASSAADSVTDMQAHFDALLATYRATRRGAPILQQAA